jgi:hypothetical protein
MCEVCNKILENCLWENEEIINTMDISEEKELQNVRNKLTKSVWFWNELFDYYNRMIRGKEKKDLNELMRGCSLKDIEFELQLLLFNMSLDEI